MTRRAKVLIHEFVEYIPTGVEEGRLYISIPFATVVHKCACGCGKEVVTPLSPTDWTLIFDGESVSLDPSIGNSGFACQSHYWITRNKVKWARQWSREEIETGRATDRLAKRSYFEPASDVKSRGVGQQGEDGRRGGLWGKLKIWRP
jgi:hypothetical protein